MPGFVLKVSHFSPLEAKLLKEAASTRSGGAAASPAAEVSKESAATVHPSTAEVSKESAGAGSPLRISSCCLISCKR